MAKPKVTVRAVADLYAGPTERIIEFSDRQVPAGGLIALRRCERPDGRHRLMVQIYRCDAEVDVVVGQPDADGVGVDAHRTAVALAQEGLRRLLTFAADSDDQETGELLRAAATVDRVRRTVEQRVDETWLSGL